MTLAGIGIKLVLRTILFAAAFGAVSERFFQRAHSLVLNGTLMTATGALLTAAGIVMLVLSGKRVSKAFREGKLATDGMYSFSRNPLYAAWIFFIIPGLVVISGRVLWLLIPIFMYALFKLLIREEDDYLEQKFGGEYLSYKSEVNEIFPWFRNRRAGNSAK